MTNMDEIITYERDLANMESRIESVSADAYIEAELPQADLDMLDVCFSMASGVVGAFVATNDDVAKWLEEVHDAASGNPGARKAFHEKWDWMVYWVDDRQFVCELIANPDVKKPYAGAVTCIRP